jgi:GNAT superfamily N-acetyltransferase
MAVISPNIRPATPQGGQSLCALLNQIIETGGITAHVNPFDRDRLFRHYIAPPFAISCLVAAHPERHHQLMGFPALEWADPNWQGVGKLLQGWAIIASFVAADCQGHGIGKALFQATRLRAQNAEVRNNDATIRADNPSGLRYSAKLDFIEYQKIVDVALSNGMVVGKVCTAFSVVKPF